MLLDRNEVMIPLTESGLIATGFTGFKANLSLLGLSSKVLPQLPFLISTLSPM